MTKSKFEWQSGFGAFTYSLTHVQNVINYIHNQKEHHTRKTFKEEYQKFLIENEIQFDPKYIFKDPE